MQALELQTGFFKIIKERLPAHMSLVQEIAELLSISSDSAYRRIRGEKTLRFDEIQLLVSHFKISLDQFFEQPSDTYFFFGSLAEKENAGIRKSFRHINEQLSIMLHAYKKEMYCYFNDVPFLYACMFPALAAFKYYILEKRLFPVNVNGEPRFRISDYSTSFGQELEKMAEAFINIPSKEIWNVSFMNSTLNQIEYCISKGLFATDEDLNAVRESLLKLVDLLEKQSFEKRKFLPGKYGGFTPGAECSIWLNPDLPLNEMLFIEADDLRLIGLHHNALNYAFTSDDDFVAYTKNSMEKVFGESIALDESKPNAHHQFFNTLRKMFYDKNARNGYAYY